MKLKFTCSFLLLICSVSISFAQYKVVIMGSSTAYGVGASSYANSWPGKTEAFLNQNTTDGLDTTFYNIAGQGYSSYQEMPTSFVSPPNRPIPDADFNVTKALSFNPDVVIISLPSNDMNYGYSKDETMSNFRVMFNTISASGARCYMTTPQPRNDFDAGMRDSLFSMVDSVSNAFGQYTLNFWNCLTTTDGLHMLRNEYRLTGTPHHLNDAGHNELFQIIMNSGILDAAGPLPIRLTNFQAQAQNNTVLLKWHTEDQEAHTIFDIQRSSNGNTFETISTQTVADARPSANYVAVDETPLGGKSFYRLKITEENRQFYSPVVNVFSKGRALDIAKLFTNNSGSALNATINIQKSQVININILNTSGTVVSKQTTYINQPTETMVIPVGKLATGQYYMQVVTADGNKAVKAFIK
jgi:lysophospholipase L1-like esterase